MTNSYLTELGVIHGDMKPGNILIFPSSTETLIPKLIDFGYSSMALLRDDKLAIGCTWGWAAPEWTGRLFTLLEAKKMDVYSFGLVCLLVTFGDRFSAEMRSDYHCHDSLLQAIARAIDAELGAFPEQARQVAHFFTSALSEDPEQRGDIAELLESISQA